MMVEALESDGPCYSATSRTLDRLDTLIYDHHDTHSVDTIVETIMPS
jgi:hypothetical protein